MKKSKSLLILTFIMLFAVLLFTGQALALSFGPGDADLEGNENNTAQILAVLAGLGITTEVYKQDVGGPETGALAGYYTTTFSNTETDPEDAEIEFDGGTLPFIAEWLLVKDGNQEPAWYAFDLTGWDGMETINLNGFWPNQGAISHVAMYGGTSVPEPATMFLLGTGLLGLAGLRRKIKK